MIGCCKSRTLKNYLVTAKITKRDAEESKIAQCNVKFCQVCQYIEQTLMEISTIFVHELQTATQILLFINFTLALVLNNT